LFSFEMAIKGMEPAPNPQ